MKNSNGEIELKLYGIHICFIFEREYLCGHAYNKNFKGNWERIHMQFIYYAYC